MVRQGFAVLLLVVNLGIIHCDKTECGLMKKAIDCVWKAFQDINKNSTIEAGEKGKALCRSASGANKLAKCVTDNMKYDEFKGCFKPTEVFQISKNIEMLKNGAAFWCKDSGSYIQKYLNDNGTDCFNANKDIFKNQCNSSYLMNYAHTTKERDFCDVQRRSMDCIAQTVINETKACNNVTKDIITTFIDTVRKDSPCNHAACPLQLSTFAALLTLVLHFISSKRE